MQLVNGSLKRQNGFALVVVLSLLFLVTGLALVSFSTSDTDRKISSNYYETTNAYYAAEAGVVRVCATLKDSLSWRGSYTNVTVAGGKGKFTTDIQDSSSMPALTDSLFVTSTGKIPGNPGSETVVQALLAPLYSNSRFKWAAFGRDKVTLSGGALSDSYDSDSGSYASQAIYGPDSNGNTFARPSGDLGGNGTITLSGNSVVHGGVKTSSPGGLSVGGGYVYGDTSSTVPPAVLDSIPTSEINYAMANNRAPAGLSFIGSASFNSSTKELSASSGGKVTFSSGTYYFSSVSFVGGSIIEIAPGAEVKIYITGDWNTSGGGMVNTDGIPGNVEIYSTGTRFDFSGGSGFWGAVFAPNAKITVSGGGHVYGSVVGREIANTGGSQLHYDEAIGRRRGPLANYRVKSWKVL